MVNGVEPYPKLDHKCISILKSIAQHDGEATTTEVRKSSSVQSRQEIHYRVNGTLEPRGFLSSYQPEGEPGKWPPKELRLTEKGREVLEEVVDADDPTGNIGDRVETLENKVDSLQETLAGLETLPDSDVDLDQLQKQVTSIASDVNKIKENSIFDDDLQRQLNGVMAFSGVMKDYLIEELGEDEVFRRFDTKRDNIVDFDPSE